MRGGLAPETALLLASARGARGAAEARLLVARHPLDWALLLRLARRERATAALWECLDRGRCPGMPADAAAALDRLARVSSFRLAVLQQRLTSVLSLLATHEFPVVLLKGAALSRAVYPRATDRPMDDLDLLVPQARAAAAFAAMHGAGWTLPLDGDPVEVARRYAGHHHLPPLDDVAGTGIGLELHTELFPRGHPFAFGAAAMWRRSRAREPSPPGVLVPHPNDLLLHACIHFAWSHLLASGAWRTFRDVDVLARHVDWQAFVGEAHEARAATCCYWTLRLAHALGGVSVERRVLRALRPPGGEALLDALTAHFALGLFPTSPRCPSVRLSRALWRAGVRPGWSGHGPVCPWTLDAQFTPEPAAAATAEPDLRRRLGAQVARAGAWRAYGRAVLRARQGG